MFTYDALAFIQAAFVFWVIVALSAVLVRAHSEAAGSQAGDVLSCADAPPGAASTLEHRASPQSPGRRGQNLRPGPGDAACAFRLNQYL